MLRIKFFRHTGCTEAWRRKEVERRRVITGRSRGGGVESKFWSIGRRFSRVISFQGKGCHWLLFSLLQPSFPPSGRPRCDL